MLARKGRECFGGWPEQINARFFQNRLSGCSDEQGFIISVILFPSLDPAPDIRAATAFSHSQMFPVVASGSLPLDHFPRSEEFRKNLAIRTLEKSRNWDELLSHLLGLLYHALPLLLPEILNCADQYRSGYAGQDNVGCESACVIDPLNECSR